MGFTIHKKDKYGYDAIIARYYKNAAKDLKKANNAKAELKKQYYTHLTLGTLDDDDYLKELEHRIADIEKHWLRIEGPERLAVEAKAIIKHLKEKEYEQQQAIDKDCN